MRLCTIATADWVDGHLRRWARYAAKNSPKTPMGLCAIGGGGDLGGVAGLEKVVVVDQEVDVRPFVNEIRMDFFGLFDGACIYCDCDADVLMPLEDLEGAQPEKTLLCCKSPATRDDWVRIWDELNLGDDVHPEMNNGFLVMRKSFLEEYHQADDIVKGLKTEINPRTRGQMVFNVMLHKVVKGQWGMLGDDVSVVWWDKWAVLKGRCIQWCNDQGQRRRLELEQLWRAVNP